MPTFYTHVRPGLRRDLTQASSRGKVASMTRFSCPYLQGDVELSDERERHIAEQHPDLLPKHRACLAGTLAQPDHVRRSSRFSNARLFARHYNELGPGKHTVVVVVSEAGPEGRHCIVTAYITRKLAGGVVEWQRK
jgi:hypothetical protein